MKIYFGKWLSHKTKRIEIFKNAQVCNVFFLNSQCRNAFGSVTLSTRLYLLLALSRFQILLWFFHCWIWTSVCRLGSGCNWVFDIPLFFEFQLTNITNFWPTIMKSLCRLSELVSLFLFFLLLMISGFLKRNSNSHWTQAETNLNNKLAAD